ncbi:MAG TPA: PEPxxWA-CTERM sorting domain-containing protein [Blastocatellia bacterium]|nr:PEPxxWA-CTERM sorting domain-containing protein [Blastocatellia bacterium]
MVYTVGSFDQAADPSGFLGVGGVTDNLGSFTLGADARTYTGDIFRLLVNFTQPGTGSQLYQALLQGTVTSVNGGSVFINFDNTPQLITASNGSEFTLQVNDVSVAAGGAVQVLSGQLQAVPEPATWAMMLLGFAGIGMTIRRGRKPALAQIA